MDTLRFAEYELKRYMAAMGQIPQIELSVDACKFDPTKFFRFDPKLDDAFSIRVKGGAGEIIATNERAVLLGVYHFLKKQGCRFIHPGDGGEIIPQIESIADVDEVWYAKMRHRGTTDMVKAGPGGVIDIILRYIDWLPKMMANSFFIEYSDYYARFKKPYEYTGNPYKEADDLSREQFEKFDKMMAEELKKRGIIRHGAGHGWTVELMGLHTVLHETDDSLCEHPEILAEINGERKFFKGVPLYTNLCYSNPEVRKNFAQLVYDYAVSHPEVDVVHVWLGDQFSNFCECEECKKKTATDQYVSLLNDIDALFTEKGLDRKIGFLAYFELAYPPVTERLNNEDRFVFMFAPYERDFRVRYQDVKEKQFVDRGYNTYKDEDMDVELYLSELRGWKKAFGGDSFVFDYTFFERAYNADITNVTYAKNTYDDTVFLPELGVNGRIECGDIRTMTPTALAWHQNLLPLFYGDVSYEKIYRDYFDACYGEGEPISAFLEKAAELLPYSVMYDAVRLKDRALTAEEVEKLEKGVAEVKAFKKTLFEYVPALEEQRKNCLYFREYLDILEFVQIGMIEKAKNPSKEKTEQTIKEFENLLFRKELIMPQTLSARMWANHFSGSLLGK